MIDTCTNHFKIHLTVSDPGKYLLAAASDLFPVVFSYSR